MSTITGLIAGSGGGGAAIPINGIAQFANAPVKYTALDNTVWIKAGNIETDLVAYPDAFSISSTIATGTYLQNYSTTLKDSAPYGIFFKPDGLKMYILGVTNDKVYEYNLSTAWNVTTSVFSQEISIATQDGTAIALFMSPDGLYMYITGAANSIYYKYTLSTAWNISTATFTNSFSMAAQDTTPRGLWISSDGLKMYLLGESNIKIYQYSLSIAWDITSSTFINSKLISGQSSTNRGIWLNSDGTKMYHVGNNTKIFYEYVLTTPWDITTATYTGVNLAFGTNTTSPQDVYMSPSGHKLYVVDNSGVKIVEFTLVPPSIGLASGSGLEPNSYVRIK